ncbi:MAG TPA: PDZ domain-containing protein [Terriglobales bacterium]|nr:PDZ domain-containing protein [Terriglobales bacterium]
MRKTGTFVWLAALVVGLALVAGLAVAPGARAAEQGQPTPWLGVYMQALTPELREGMDIQGAGGVLVSGVVSDGPAARAGVQKGDVILRVNSRLVSSPNQLQDVIQSARVGQTVALQIYRDGNQRSLSATLRERPSDVEEMQAPEGTEQEEEATPETPAPGEQREIREFTLPDMSMFPGMMTRGRLGVRIESLSPDLGDYFGMRDGHGVLVLEVEDNTPAARAGLKAGDVITRVGDQSVDNAQDLVDALRGKQGNVSLRVVRHGTPRTIEARLESAGTMGRGSMRILAPAPGARLRIENRDQMQRQIDELKRQVEDLQRKLEQKGSGGGN